MAFPGLVRANNLSDVVDRERAWDNIGSGLSSGSITIPTPSLDLNFAANKSLIDSVSGNNLVTFSRASTATYVDNDGLIKTAASGAPRFDHNPLTKESLGLLIEQSATNNFSYSEAFDDAYWSKVSASVIANQAVAPDGTNTADLLIGNNINTFYGCSVRRDLPLTAQASLSVFAKKNTANYCFLGIDNNAGLWARVVVDLTTGATSISNQASYVPRVRVVQFSGGWWRIQLSLDSVSGLEAFRIGMSTTPTPGAQNVNGDGVSGIYIWGAQAEEVRFATSYISTSGSAVTRSADVARITGSSFSPWFNTSEGTLYGQCNTIIGGSSGFFAVASLGGNSAAETDFIAIGLQDTVSTRGVIFSSGVSQVDLQGSSYLTGATLKQVLAFRYNDCSYSASGITPISDGSSILPTVSNLFIGANTVNELSKYQGNISRIVYWPVRLQSAALRYITSNNNAGVSSYDLSFQVKGRDILALENIRSTSTRDFALIKGLSATAQPRITTAANNTASGVARRDLAMLKLAPTTSGNYFFSSGLTLSGVSTRINGTPALSIATSPFSGSTATAPLLFRELRPQANWRITEPMPTGTIATPELAIPFETNDFVLYMKAGQN